MEKKRILLIIDSLGVGGAERAVTNLSNGFLQNDCLVDIISIDNNIKTIPPEEARLHILDFKNTTFRYYKYTNKLSNLINILEEEYKTDFDLILVNLQKSTRLMKNFKHKNIYHIIRNTLSQADLKNKKGLKKYFKKRKLQKLYDNLNLITLSDGIKDDLLNTINIKPKSIQTINNSINFEFINSQANMEINDNIIDQIGDYIIHVGRFSDAKRHDILLKSFAESNLNTHLILVGDGPNKIKIKKLIDELNIKDKVIMLGFKNNPYPYIKNAKLLVLSSDFEGMPNVILEALALKTPVVSTNCKSGPSEILTDSYSQYLSEPQNVKQLSDLILHTYSNPYKVDNKITNRFKLAHIINQYNLL